MTERVVEMKLTQGKTTLFDVEDLEKVRERVWHVCHFPSGWHAVAKVDSKSVRLERYLFPEADNISHPDGDALNNRRSNIKRYDTVDNSQKLDVHPRFILGAMPDELTFDAFGPMHTGKNASKNHFRYTNAEATIVEMQLTKNYLTRFSAEHLNKVTKYLWRAQEMGSGVYATTCVTGDDGKVATLLLHRFIKNVTDKADVIDHINGQTLDNLDDNLRVTDSKGNCNNKRMNSRNKTGVNGVGHCAKQQKYQAYYMDKGKMISLTFPYGSKRSQEEAFELAVAARRIADEQSGCQNGKRPKFSST